MGGPTAAVAQTAAADGGWLHWLAADVGLPTALGMVICSVLGAALGYLVSALGWRWWIAHKWSKRHREQDAHASFDESSHNRVD